jgi:hypothetical protein
MGQALKCIGGVNGQNFGRFYRIRTQVLCFDSSGRQQILRNTFDYAILGSIGTPVSKQGLIQSGAVNIGGTVYCGFLAQVYIPMMTALNVGAQPYGIYCKDRLNIDDHDDQLSPWQPNIVPPTSAGVNVIPAQFTWNGVNLSWSLASMFPGLTAVTTPVGKGSITSRMPLEDTVVIRKYTGVSGRNWSKGNWKFAPIDEIDVTEDNLNSNGTQAFSTTAIGPALAAGVSQGLKQCLYASITDGVNVLQPIMVSTELSQLRRLPTRIAFAPLSLTGNYNYLLNQGPPLLNLTIGRMGRRQQKPLRTDRSDLRV